ncbi:MULTISPECIES: T9SS type A sorting domain-containing protein [Flavobacterium]|uniref:T9SS type A sorting domain-containing protein n=1 Tax=Flavobacterium jumunjinense TaxID=998845 RepID=A0ABV5GRU9_9FLAO|nr:MULTISPECIES: T9SS type A sorting domain-containing protein [Flavobacterium]
MKKRVLFALFVLFTSLSIKAQCGAAANITVTNIVNNSMTVSWTDPASNAVSWSIGVFYDGVLATTISVQSSPYVITGLPCNKNITNITVNKDCGPGNGGSSASTTVGYVTNCNFGSPENIAICSDTPTVCFDLTSNNATILGNYAPSNYTINYFSTQTDALDNINPVASPYCVDQNTVLFSRITDNSDPTIYQINSFTLLPSTYINMNALSHLVQCDDDNDGSITYDLTTSQALIATTNTLTYYLSFQDATNEVNSISNPATFAQTNSGASLVYIRESIVNDCDKIYRRNLIFIANCNSASVCDNANSLCGSLDTPFNNTTGVQSIGNHGCLTTTPNPTWFYFPVSQSGTLNFEIKQGDNAPDYNNQDVDYIVYGPFTNQSEGCTLYNDTNIVACSYSTASTEYPIIPNALAGEYYLLMVTNFSNDVGFISIDLLPTSTGIIDCTGLSFVSFLDTNSNGVQDIGEVNFPLGNFDYEKNNDGTIHTIFAPNGTFNIYDNDIANAYDVNFTILSNYASYYNVTIAPYTGLNPTSGMMTYYFPVTPLQNYEDVSVVVIPTNQPRPGFNYTNKVVYTNLGNQTVSAGTITFNTPSAVTINNTNPATVPNANGFTYDYTNLLPFEIRSIDVAMDVPTVPTVNGGDYLTSTAAILPIVNDVAPSNNDHTLTELVVNAYDPNDKTESHGPEILQSSFTAEDYLIYTIRFENTGNAAAINVSIEDVLNSQLDTNTLEMVSASHAYEMDRIEKTITWKFNGIMLPVSQANSTVGKGYVTFKIKPLAGYAVGDIIPNTAAIYFDFNPAIVTNTFTTEFVSTLSNGSFNTENIHIYPNPTQGILTVNSGNNAIQSIVLYDMLGNRLFTELPLQTETSLDISNLQTGIYILELRSNDNERLIQKIIKK